MFSSQHYFKLAEVLNYSLKVAESKEPSERELGMVDALVMHISHLGLMLQNDNSSFNVEVFEAFVYEDTSMDTDRRSFLRDEYKRFNRNN